VATPVKHAGAAVSAIPTGEGQAQAERRASSSRHSLFCLRSLRLRCRGVYQPMPPSFCRWSW
jgi:hypothetical protein